ncbi:adiponectin receptor protein isoform X4 [Daktulosphaira vitifoliae]|uniref:adiponectin receptor protein isoform X4 n=1 Tax=Daktulosphaira vitifoliae TaxID=58002 RepID=UPI0021A9E3D8|nr:adiponectin receptor protein isoform X4 [Daktulosphaira vitifoliae]
MLEDAASVAQVEIFTKMKSEDNCLEKIDLLSGPSKENNDITTYETYENMDITSMAQAELQHVAAQARDLGRKMWNVCHFHNLPQWLQDNDFLHTGHRPPLNSFQACFQSIFRIHTETGNIWTHLLGCIAFFVMTLYFATRPEEELSFQDKFVFITYFIGAITCMGLSFVFHTVHCHSETVGKLFSKLDYCGIAILIMGSFVPWLYYGFYCEPYSWILYLVLVIALGLVSMIVALWDKFSDPSLRPLRAGVFMTFGLIGVIPAMHYGAVEGFFSNFTLISLGWLLLMGFLYIAGALLYALRVPERFFPGKCDLLFQSHQIFHVLVILAAFVHYHGITKMAEYRLSNGECEVRPAVV